MNEVTVLLFATLRDRAQTRALNLTIPADETIGGLKQRLCLQFPALQGLMEHCLASINHEYRFDEDTLPAQAEVAFFPPVSGG